MQLQILKSGLYFFSRTDKSVSCQKKKLGLKIAVATAYADQLTESGCRYY
jgi:hypothetical protein